MVKKVAVVTGGNKGIGFGIVQGLCKKFDGVVYLTARDVERGEYAVAELRKLGLDPKFHRLDITDIKSIEQFRDHIEEAYGGIDLLVNNAGIAFKVNSTESFAVQAEITTKVNYYGTLNACQILLPILRPNARIVNLSSSCGHLSRIPSEELRKKFSDSNLTIPQLSELIDEFVSSAKNGTNVADGWGQSAYNVSKVGVSALTFILNREHRSNLIVNCVHPGYVDTNMSSHKGIFSIERGVLAPLYLALNSSDDVRGVYMWHDKTIVDWCGPSPGPY